MVSVLCFLAITPFTRSVTVEGSLARSAGVAEIVAPRLGTVSDVRVVEGEHVKKGTVLATLETDRYGEGSEGFGKVVTEAIAEQANLTAAQAAAAGSKSGLDVRSAQTRAAAIGEEIALIEKQMAAQRGLIETAEHDLERIRGIAKNGFISRRDVQIREETLVSRQLALSQSQQLLVSRRLAREEALNEANSIQVAARSEQARLAVARMDFERARAEAEGDRSYSLRSPIAGRVTAIVANVGKSMPAGDVLMSVEPYSSKLVANLRIPSEAVGFVREGQSARLAIDAFPYQRFGHINGKIISVASAPTIAPGAAGKPYFLAKIELDETSIRAFGRRESLKSGMLAEAKVEIARQSLFTWLFEPLFAARSR
ncbi:hypothetical protein ATE76_20355 [Sphingopyxis sp. H093]|nr:hypothetical protein ATE76_20355 [Sphingopyxis sp. H093]KTE63798.1 hypothetical protein ATE74_18660 [Sphingopyxis sp. H085]